MSGMQFCSAYELLAFQLLQMKKKPKKHNDNQKCGILKKKKKKKKEKSTKRAVMNKKDKWLFKFCKCDQGISVS